MPSSVTSQGQATIPKTIRDGHIDCVDGYIAALMESKRITDAFSFDGKTIR